MSILGQLQGPRFKYFTVTEMYAFRNLLRFTHTVDMDCDLRPFFRVYHDVVSKKTLRKTYTMSRKYSVGIGNLTLKGWITGAPPVTLQVKLIHCLCLQIPVTWTVVLCRVSSPFLVEDGRGWSVFLQQKIRLSRCQPRKNGFVVPSPQDWSEPQ